MWEYLRGSGAAGPGLSAARRDVRVLGEEERGVAVLLDEPGERARLDGVVRGERRDARVHAAARLRTRRARRPRAGRARASAASRRTRSPAGSSGASGYAWPAHRLSALGVAAGARRGAQRRGQVVHVGVGGRRVAAVLGQEAVDDPARRAAGERAGERGRRVCLQRGALRRRGGGLGRAHEHRAELGGAGPGGEHGGDRAAGGEAARGDQRQLDGGAATSWRSASSPRSPGRRVVEGAAVAARLDALGDQRVRARLGRARRPPRAS